MMQRIRWFLLLLGIVVALVLSLYNSDVTSIKIPFAGEWELPLSMLLLTTSAISFVFGAIMTGWMLRSRRKATAAKEREAAKQEASAPAIEAPSSSTESSTEPASAL